MTKRRIRAAASLATIAAALYLCLGYITARIHWVRAAPASSVSPHPTFPTHLEIVTALHVHTRLSHDALGSESDVVRAARVAGLDVVILTDHRERQAPDSLQRSQARYSDGILLVRGEEVTLGAEVGRVLVFGLDSTIHDWREGAKALGDVFQEHNATGIVAHTRSPRTRDSWRPDSTLGMAGWEVFDFADIGRIRLTDGWVVYHLLALAGGALVGRLDRSLIRLYREGFDQPGVAAFDSMYDRAPITALAGLDAHPKQRLGGRLVPGYTPFFEAMTNHILLHDSLSLDPDSARLAVAGAIEDGHVYISFFGAENARGFHFGSVSDSRGLTPMGGSTELSPGLLLRAAFDEPPTQRILMRVVRDGRTHVWSRGSRLELPLQTPGAYRLEVFSYSLRIGSLYWNRRPWIFTNPVRILRESTGREVVDVPRQGGGRSVIPGLMVLAPVCCRRTAVACPPALVDPRRS